MSRSDVPTGAGDLLLKAVEQSRQQADRRARFQDWLGAYTIAAHIVEALARRPGLRDVQSTVIRNAFQQIASAADRAFRHIEKRLGQNGLPLTDAGHRMQVKRLVFEAVARHWPDDPNEVPALFRAIPSREDAISEDFSTQITLLHGYLNEVAELIEQQAETPPGERSMAEDYHLDRLLAAHTLYLRAHDVLVPFFKAQIDGQPTDWQALVAGKADGVHGPITATDLVHRVVNEVILPIADERHAHLLAVFDPQARFGPHDRHMAYRALITNVTADMASIMRYEHDDLIGECQGRYETPGQDAALDHGVLLVWLTGQINYRLDRVYPRPDEYIGAGG